MPHVIVKISSRQDKGQKLRFAQAVTRDVFYSRNVQKTWFCRYRRGQPDEWAKKVHIPDIVSNEAKLYKKPASMT